MWSPFFYASGSMRRWGDDTRIRYKLGGGYQNKCYICLDILCSISITKNKLIMKISRMVVRSLMFVVMSMVIGVQVQAASISKPKAGEAFVAAPFVCNFDLQDDMNQWTLLSNDGDEYGWIWRPHSEWPALDGKKTGGCVRSTFNSINNNDDWMITDKPVRLSAGKVHIAYLYAAGHRSEEETLSVYYGKSNAVADLKKNKVETFSFCGRDWRLKVHEITLTEAGDYYFAFQSQTEKDRLYTYLDEIEIGEGDYKGAANLSVDYIYLPVSSCALGQSDIEAMVVNRGKTDVLRYELSYSINNGTPVKEEFAVRIPYIDTLRVKFAQKADFSELGTKYTVKVEAKILETASGKSEADNLMADNTLIDSVRHFTKTTLPFVTDMNVAAERVQWAYAAGSWSYDASKVLAIRAEDTLPLVSRCMTLDGGRHYRFALEYVAGMEIFAMVLSEDFEILCGLAGTPVDSWRSIQRYDSVQTGNYLTSDEFVFSIENTGDYAFAIVSRRLWGILYIGKVSVTEIKDHDMMLSDWVTRLGRLTPAHHAVKPSFEALVANRGMNDETGVYITLRQGDQEIGRTTAISIKKDSLAVFRPIDGQISKPALNSNVTLKLSVEMPSTDGNPHDNATEFTFTATDSLYAFDHITDPAHGISAAQTTIGNIFMLAEQDTITAVNLAWVNISDKVFQDFDVAVEIYPVDMLTKTVKPALLSHRVKRGLTGGIRRVEFPARVLPEGRYLIGVRQLGKQNLMLAVDDHEDGYFFATDGSQYIIESRYGFLGVRAVFGTPQKMKAKDMEMTAILAPKDKGAFTAREQVRASYVNNGSQAMEVEFKCTVGSQVLTKKQTVKAYEIGVVSFVADLSQPGRYTILVEATGEGDEDLNNNAIKKDVECVVIDPRVMDFEYCEDFAVSGFTPSWKSVDMDGTVPGPHNLTIPNVDKPFGFMAYNSYEAGEVDENGQFINIAHSGQKCGMSLVTAKNNDWLISPEFALAKSGDSIGVSLWVMSSDPEFLEWYKVLVSTTNDKPASFMPVPDSRGAELREAPGKWTKVWVDLSAYAGKNVYVAIQCVSEDAWMFFIDDICVKTGGKVNNDQNVDLSRYVRSYPNPVTDVWTVTAYDLLIDRVEIYNITGEPVFRSASGLNTESYRVSMGGFTPGLYMARIYTNAGVQTLKVVVR